MSGNQKPTTGAGGPGQPMQRYSSSPYPQNIPPPSLQRDYHTNAQNYVSAQQANQAGGNQGAGGGLRPLPQTGPPNQAPTPPNSDIKVVQSVSQQPSINQMYAAPSSVQGRQAQPNYYTRATGPNQSQRMPNQQQHRAQQQLYPAAAQASYAMQMPIAQNMFMPSMQYPFPQQRPQLTGFVPNTIQVFTPYPYTPTQTQPQNVPYSFISMRPTMQQHPAAPPSQPPTPIQPMPIAQPPMVQQTYAPKQGKRRANAIAIIDPITGQNKLDEIYDNDSSHPPSGESSARQTPQPTTMSMPPQHTTNKEVQATFAKQVAQAMSEDLPLEEPADHHHHHHHPHHHHISGGDHTGGDPSSIYHSHQAVHPNRFDQLAQSSSLKPHAKEFILPNTAKEETPIVSANCDAREVIVLPNKSTKDSESPIKGRKVRHLKEPTREPMSQPIDKQTSVVHEEIVGKPKEMFVGMVPSSSAVATGVPRPTTPTIVPHSVPAPASPTIGTFVRDDKKISKKDTKDPPKLSNVEVMSDCTVNLPASQQDLDVSLSAINAKSKQNAAAQRSKEVQKPGPTPPPQASHPNKPSVPPPSVPQSQPPKASSKTNKKAELNSKGISKEGTDMDAINDNIVTTETTTIAADLSKLVRSEQDIINANSVSNIPSPLTPSPPPFDKNVNATNELNKNEKTLDAVEMSKTEKTIRNEQQQATIKIENKEKNVSKPRVNVMNIFPNKNENTSNMVVNKLYPTPQGDNIAMRDETDRAAAFSNDKLVQAKNEANAKASSESAESNNVIEYKPNLPYGEGQWAPNNKDGKKIYDKEFLMALKDLPCSKVKPTNLPESVIIEDRSRGGERFNMGNRTDFTPNFQTANYGKSGSRAGKAMPQGRASLTGKPNQRSNKSSNNGGGMMGGTNKISISLREDIKLHESENAWKPNRLVKEESATDEDKKTEELNKRVRGVLNKLTPEKFDTLVSQVSKLEIETEDRLRGVIDLVFEKAVDEPNFSVAYAQMCSSLASLQVPVTGSKPEDKVFVNFRKLLVSRCQSEFEKQSRDESQRVVKLKEIEDCLDVDKKKELEFELEEYDRRLRMRSVGTIRFIGELFKGNQLTVKIMLRCLDHLLENKEEENLECLCKLLTTIGQELEVSKKTDLKKYFNTMKDIVDKKHGPISSRIKFMLQDVLDLRRSKWVPRRQDLNPKTIEQIQKEAEHEHMTIQSMNATPGSTRKDDRSNIGGGGGGGGGINSKRKTTDDGGWTMNVRQNRSVPFTVQSDKLKNTLPQNDAPLGSHNMFGNWGRGSNIKTTVPSTSYTNTANKYAALDNMDMEKKMPMGMRQQGKESYGSKSSSMERGNYNKQHHPAFDGRGGSRSGSQQRLNDAPTTVFHRNISNPPPPPAALPHHAPPPMRLSSSSSSQSGGVLPMAPVAVTPRPPPIVAKLNEEQLERHCKNSLEEYLNDNCSFDEFVSDIKSTVPVPYMHTMVLNGCFEVLAKSVAIRMKIGKLFAKLIKINVLPLDEFSLVLEDIFSQGDDLKIDIPKLWLYLAEILVPFLCEEALPLRRLHQHFGLVTGKSEFLGSLFRFIVEEKGPNFLQSQLQKSSLSIQDFIPEHILNDFVRQYDLQFLVGGPIPVGRGNVTADQFYEKLMSFFSSGASLDDISSWISANLGERVNENKFVRALATSIFTHSIRKNKLCGDQLKSHYLLLQKYGDNNPNFDLQCLYALQALVHKLEHPQNLLTSICFQLHEDLAFPQEAFFAWENSNDPAEQEGKGVALKQLTSFFNNLKENEDDYSSTSDEA